MGSFRVSLEVPELGPDQPVVQEYMGGVGAQLYARGSEEAALREGVEGLGGSERGDFFRRPPKKESRALAMMAAAHELQ